MVGPLSGTATMADLAPLRDPAVHVVHVTPANDLGGLPRYELAVEEASAGFAALRRPAEVLQVVFRYV